MGYRLLINFFVLNIALCFIYAEDIQVKLIQSAKKTEIEKKVFGHFLEKPSWGETGYEDAVDEDGKLNPLLEKKLLDLDMPIVRFPGGIDIDYTNWVDMLKGGEDGLRKGGAKITIGHQGHKISNKFTYDDYFQLQARGKWETILVVNFLDGVSKKIDLQKAAENAAALVAYTNGELKSELPDKYKVWVERRIKNGHPLPYKVTYFQIGNEWWAKKFKSVVKNGTKLSKKNDLYLWYKTCILAYAKEMKLVDPTIQLIIDGSIGFDIEALLLKDEEIKNNINLIALHAYGPGKMNDITKKNKVLPLTEVQLENLWYSFSTTPGGYDKDGQNIACSNEGKIALENGFKLAITEWNWNGWSSPLTNEQLSFDYQQACIVGTAGFVHGLLRESGNIKLANQSMLIGHSWPVAGYLFKKNDLGSLVESVQLGVLQFFANHHGKNIEKVEIKNNAYFTTSYRVGWSNENVRFGLVDVCVTSNEKFIFLHLINREFASTRKINFDLSDVVQFQNKKCKQFSLELVAIDKISSLGKRLMVNEKTIEIDKQVFEIVLEPKSAMTIQIPL